MSKVKITGEWTTLEPMGLSHHSGYKRDGIWDETTYWSEEGRIHDGMFCVRVTYRTTFANEKAGAPDLVEVKEKSLFPAADGQRIGRRDGGEYVARDKGQYHIAVVAM